MSGSFIYRHHVEPRVKLYSPREESFPIPLKYIDVSRTTHTNLECYARTPHRRLLAHRCVQNFVRFMERIHKVYSIERETSKGTNVVRGETDKSSSDIQARSFMARTLESYGKECWAIEKPKLDKARRLRGIYFIDPEDKEFKEAIKNARKKLETPMAPAMPCKTCKKSKHGETRGKTNEIKSKLACLLEASESTRMRMEESLQNYHEDHIAGREDNSLQHYNLAHKFIPMLQAMKIPAAKAAVDKELEKLEKISAWNLTKVRSKKR